MNDDAMNDAVAMANAFRAANDEDTMQVMNVQSRSAHLDHLAFYVVPALWMKAAWPILTGQTVPSGPTWREAIGKIECGELLLWENAVSSDDEEDVTSQQQKHSNDGVRLNDYKLRQRVSNENRFTNLQQPTLREGLVHEQDFFLLGSNAWLLVKQKFGYDHEVKRTCVEQQQSMESKLAVVMYEADAGQQQPVLLPIPPTGRFRYEVCLNNQNNIPNVNPNEPDDAAEQQQQLNRPSHPGNVSDDETQEEDDLFPNMQDDDRMSTDPVDDTVPLLLPPSTTPTPLHDDLPSPLHDDLDYWGNQSSHSVDDNDMDEDKSDVIGTGSVPQIRRYGSGLGNLGNTCFMNSTIQCLAHTDPLQRYFLSGEYERDLNRDNPLGTGGDLAVEFAELLAEMWGTSTKPRGSSAAAGLYSSTNGYSSAFTSTNVVYPRNFKYALGKHAEQFVGYDQHDSQELATYLLDALHEDTNRVTNKPYVEKPEQAEGETDEEAANKAWELHLKREDSRVLDSFMGQIKSRVQCSEEGCGRVSTTFDPSMYLSVPIPGSSERTLRVTFVPLDPCLRPQSISVTLNKTALVDELLQKVKEQLVKFKLIENSESLAIEDLAAADVWQKEIYSWYENKNEVERIRDTDETFVYQLRPLAEVRDITKKSAKDEEASANELGVWNSPRSKRYQVDIGTLTRLNRDDEWHNEMSKYLRNPLQFVNAFNPKKGSTDERVKLYQRLTNFIDLCHTEVEGDTSGQKRNRDESCDQSLTAPEEETIQALLERCDSSPFFESVKTRHDLAVLEFCAGKMRTTILRMEREKKQEYPDGILIQVRPRKSGSSPMVKEQNIGAPLILRIPSNMTVYGLRDELARRMARSLKTGHVAHAAPSSGQSTSESDVVRMDDSNSTSETHLRNNGSGHHGFGSPELLILRQIPLSYDRKSTHSYRIGSFTSKKLGSLEKAGTETYDTGRPISLASFSDEDEKQSVAEFVGDKGSVFMDWPVELCERVFEVSEYENVEDPTSREENDAVATRTRGAKTITVLDCIEKYCQMEQLEETEMWYCNMCKKHVRAWKQYHLYRTPPILIVHLKRFQYSATTHRRDKIDVFIDFPLEGLDLTEHVMNWTEEEKPIYDCYAVSNHFGGLGGGHYTAYALNSDGVWCYYDDSRITTDVDPKEVVSQAAYVLYYRRRDVPVNGDILLNLQTQPELQTPAIIQDSLEKGTEQSEAASSNAAMVGEDETMDDVGSRPASPLGSMEGNDEPFAGHNYGEGLPTDDDDQVPPLQ